MCKSLDVAVALLDKSIELAKNTGDQRYYMDFVKVHKLLYLAQCYIQYQHGMDLFEETVTAHNCGPYIGGLDLLPAKCGFSEITEVPAELREYIVPLPLSFTRLEVLDYVLQHYGTYSTREIVRKTKETSAYRKHDGNYDNRPVMITSDMAEVGKELRGTALTECPNS